MSIFRDILNQFNKKDDLEDFKEWNKEGEKILSTYADIIKDTKQIFGAEVSQDTLSDYLENHHYPNLKNLPHNRDKSELELLQEIKNKGLEASIVEFYGKENAEITKQIHLEAFNGSRDFETIEPTIQKENKKRRDVEYGLFEKPSNFKDLHNSYTQDIMVESWNKDRCNGIGGVVFNTSLNQDQYLVLFYAEVDKALKKGRDFEEIMEVVSKEGLNTLMPQNGSTKESFQKYCNDFIEKQKEAGQQIKYPKILEEQKQEIKATQKRVSPQVRAEMEKKAQRQGRSR